MSPWAYVLLASLAANAGLSYLWLGARDDVATGEVLLEDARGAASACSDATDALRELADKRKKEADGLRKLAAGIAAGHEQKADEILATPPSEADDCRAAATRQSIWLKGRK